MKYFKGFLLGIVCSTLFHFWLVGWDSWSEHAKDKWIQFKYSVVEKKSIDDMRDTGNEENIVQETSALPQVSSQLSDIRLGMETAHLLELLGEPARIDVSAYGYQWWIYNQEWENYIQLGVKEGKVVTFYTNAPLWSWGNLKPGMNSEQWQKEVTLKDKISFHYQSGYYSFTLSAEDLQERPLLLDNNTAIQLYMDVHDQEKLSAIRVMDLETLLLHRPYALEYIGKLPEPPSLTEEQWAEIALASERQIFDLVNVSRYLAGLPLLEWHEQVAKVARGHSTDMLDNQFFAHDSPQRGDLRQRLEQGQIAYLAAGENIAWNYSDGADAHEGWLNSLGHRQNILKKDYSHLGVGVVEKYYTQNFILY